MCCLHALYMYYYCSLHEYNYRALVLSSSAKIVLSKLSVAKRENQSIMMTVLIWFS